MKVVFWTEKYLPHIGGVEVFGAELMQDLRSRGYSFAVVTCKSDSSLADEDVINGVPVYRFRFQEPLIERDLREVRKLCDKISAFKEDFRPDLIHMNTTLPSVFYHLHTFRDDQPTVVTIHSPPLQLGATHLLYSRLVKTARQVTVVSDATRNALLQAVPEIAGHTKVVYNGLVPPTIAPAPLPFDPIHIVCAGRVVIEKGFDIALRAFQLFLDTHPDARMTIAGDGPERTNLETLAADLGISDSVVFPGWVDRLDVPSLMNTATIVVVPSRWEEPFGLVALQGAQVARPVIASRVGGLPEVVVDGETGLVVEAERPRLLLSSMLKLVNDPGLANRLGRQGHKRAMDEFTMTRCADRYDAIYRESVD